MCLGWLDLFSAVGLQKTFLYKERNVFLYNFCRMNKKVEIVKNLLYIVFLNVYAVSVNGANLKTLLFF